MTRRVRASAHTRKRLEELFFGQVGKKSDLSDVELLYLFVDGIAERLHLDQPREPVLAAWGITTQGQKVLLGLAPGRRKTRSSAGSFCRT